jgi:hypothetical protein
MNTYILLLFLFVIAVLGATIAGFVYFYWNLMKKFTNIQKENVYLKFHMQEKSLAKVNATKEKAMKIIQDATVQAEDILKRANVVKTDTSDAFQKQLQELTQKQQDTLNKASEELSNSFEQTIQQIEQDDVNVLRNVAQDLQTVTEKQIESFEQKLHDETIGTQETIDEKIQQAFKKAEADVEQYKQERLEKLDTQYMHVLAELTKEILGKRLSFEDQKELVTASLEKAKVQLKGAAQA